MPETENTVLVNNKPVETTSLPEMKQALKKEGKKLKEVEPGKFRILEKLND